MKPLSKTQKIQAYILDTIDLSDYNVAPTKNDKEKLITIYQIFYSEKVKFDNRKLNEAILFSEWLSGLPSCLNIDFENYRILELATEFGYSLTTEKAKDTFLSNWFDLVTSVYFKMKTK